MFDIWYDLNMRIISWNVNGLRAVYKKGYWDWLMEESPDIFCIQETKCNPNQLPNELIKPVGFSPFFDYAKDKKGYSGVATYSKIQPEKVEYVMGIDKLDREGRLLAMYFKNFVLLNVYFPNGGGGPKRLKFKLDFYGEFLKYIEKLRKKQKNVIFCGDVNTAHKEIDLARPKENAGNTGFLPIERAWIEKLVKAGYVDVFRLIYPDKKEVYTYWDMKTFARDRNVGWRIDYFFITKEMLPYVKGTSIHDSVLGSDHCPISIDLGF